MLIDTYPLSFHFELVTEDSTLRRYIVMNILEIIRFQKYGKYRSGPFTSETSWTSVIATASKTTILFLALGICIKSKRAKLLHLEKKIIFHLFKDSLVFK